MQHLMTAACAAEWPLLPLLPLLQLCWLPLAVCPLQPEPITVAFSCLYPLVINITRT